MIRPLITLALFLPLTATTQPPATKNTDRPIAIIGDRMITWPDLGPLLAEAAGAQVLEEHALSLILKEETAKRSIPVGPAQITAERTLLGEMLTKAARLPESESESLIASIRKTRGLGDLRFKSLLERNAALRAMVRAGVGDTAVTITPEDIDTAYDLKYGPRVSARLILVRSQDAVSQAISKLAAGKPFGEIAAAMSVDPSSARGGLLDPFSLSDSTYPVAVRRVLQSLEPGKVSDAISVTWGDDKQTGFALVLLENKINPPADAPSKSAAAKDLEKEIRTVRERAQMDKLAKQLLRTANISALDPSLNWSWEQRGAAK